MAKARKEKKKSKTARVLTGDPPPYFFTDRSISKIFEKLMLKQINGYINNFLSPYLCGCRKGFTTQLALLSLIEKWKKVLDKKGFGGAVLMDLSKVFNIINHDLLIANLHTYGFDNSCLVI